MYGGLTLLGRRGSTWVSVMIVYFAIYKVKEGAKDENNLYNKNILNV